MIKYLDGKVELRGGSDQDRAAAQEWMSLFWHEAVVGEVQGEAARVPLRIEAHPTNPRAPLGR